MISLARYLEVDHFAEGESPDPPFICYLLPGSDNFSADGRVYPSIPDNPEDWLDEFNTFNIYQVLPKLIELWGMNIRTDVEAKKTSCNRPWNDNSPVSPPVCAAGDFHPGSGSADYRDGE